MPFKVWAVGEEVLAADFQSFLQNQVVPVFPNVAARDASWIAPPKGALCVTSDTNTLWQFSGTAWASLLGPKVIYRAHLTSNVNFANNTTLQLTPYTVDDNLGGGVAGVANLTVPRAGLYRVTHTVRWQLSAVVQTGNPTFWAQVFLNGAVLPFNALSSATVAGQITNGTSQTVVATGIVRLAANDVLDWRARNEGGATLNALAAGTTADVEEIRP